MPSSGDTLSLGKLGYAAGQVLITTILSLSILFIIFIWLSNRNMTKTSEYNLVIKWTKKDVAFEDILREISPLAENLKLVRLDKGSSGNTSVMLIVPDGEHPIESISNKLHTLDNDVHVTFFEAKTNW